VVKDHPEGGEMEQAIIAGIAHDKSEAKITIVGVPDRTGVAPESSNPSQMLTSTWT
jgi:aspartate kinase